MDYRLLSSSCKAIRPSQIYSSPFRTSFSMFFTLSVGCVNIISLWQTQRESAIEISTDHPNQPLSKKRSLCFDDCSQILREHPKKKRLALDQREGASPHGSLAHLYIPSPFLTDVLTFADCTAPPSPVPSVSESASMHILPTPDSLNTSSHGGLQLPKEHPSGQKRGIFKRWTTDANLAIQTSLHSDSIRLLSILAATSVNILHKNQQIPTF